jgi:FkbM family methyltransferase
MNYLSSLIYNFMIYSARFSSWNTYSKIWNKLWSFLCNSLNNDVITHIHGQWVTVNFGYPYPLIARQYPFFNNPLIELVHQLYIEKKRKLVIIDVGAGIGDTVLLLEANCTGLRNEFYCIEGDKEFFCYLQKNLGELANIKMFHFLLSSSCQEENTLLRTHKGTASSQGNSKTSAITLDSLIATIKPDTIDLIKIDVDGFDGKVLVGASDILRRYSPAVIFEWHPTLCKQTGNNWTDHFNVLAEAGYSRFIWFNKFGEFSHFTECHDTTVISSLAEFCLTNRVYHDWHYDVVALHDESTISPVALAESYNARNRKSRY